MHLVEWVLAWYLVLGTLINHSNKALKQVQVSLQISKLGHLSQQEEDLDLEVARSYTILSHLYSNHIYFIFSFQFVKSWIQLLVNEICFHMWGGKLASLENLILKKFSWAYLNKIGSNFANSYWLLLAIHPIFAIGIIQGTWNQVISGTSTCGVPWKFIWHKCLVVPIQIRWSRW